MSHLPHAFEHARRLVLSAPFIFHHQTLDIPILPNFRIQLEAGPAFETYPSPRRYGSRTHELKGGVLLEIIIPF